MEDSIFIFIFFSPIPTYYPCPFWFCVNHLYFRHMCLFTGSFNLSFFLCFLLFQFTYYVLFIFFFVCVCVCSWAYIYIYIYISRREREKSECFYIYKRQDCHWRLPLLCLLMTPFQVLSLNNIHVIRLDSWPRVLIGFNLRKRVPFDQWDVSSVPTSLRGHAGADPQKKASVCFGFSFLFSLFLFRGWSLCFYFWCGVKNERWLGKLSLIVARILPVRIPLETGYPCSLLIKSVCGCCLLQTPSSHSAVRAARCASLGWPLVRKTIRSPRLFFSARAIFDALLYGVLPMLFFLLVF